MLQRAKQEIRFGTGPGMGGPLTLIDSARVAEEGEFATIGMPDHLMMPISPLIGLQAIADATTSIRLATAVLDHDFRHPGCWPRTWPHSMFFRVAGSRWVSELVGCKPSMTRAAFPLTEPRCESNDSRNT